MNRGSAGDRRSMRLLSALAALTTASAVHAQTRIIYVDDEAPAGGDGASWESAYRDLNRALAIGNPGRYEVEIRIAQGTYWPDPARLDRNRRFEVSAGQTASAVSLSILGGFAGLAGPDRDLRDPTRFVTVLSGDLAGDDGPGFANRGDNSEVLLDIHVSSPLLIDGLTVRGGSNDSAYGRRVVSIQEQVFSSPPPSPRITISTCVFVDNQTAGTTGVIDARGVDSPRSVIDLDIEDCAFEGNRDTLDGAGVLFAGENTRATIRRCRFLSNSSKTTGGALRFDMSEPYLVEDCVFAGNRAEQGGGAIWSTGPRGRLSRCTFVGNRSTQPPSTLLISPDAIQDSILRGYPGDAQSVHVRCTSPGCAGPVSVEHCDVQGGPAAFGGTGSVNWLSGNIDTDPMFVDLNGADHDIDTWEDNDLRLAAGSACIDAGRPIFPRPDATDLARNPRFFDGNGDGLARADMGAFEYATPRCVADIDHSGFVDTDDFDAFIRAFEAGC